MMGFCPMGYACRLANRAVIPTLTPEDLTDIDAARIGLKGSPTNIYKSFTPPRKGSGMMLEGSGKETVEKLFGILSAKHII